MSKVGQYDQGGDHGDGSGGQHWQSENQENRPSDKPVAHIKYGRVK